MRPRPQRPAGPRGMLLARPWRIVGVAVGCTAVVLGAIGVVLPLLPTTPFLLLAAAVFLRSSPRMHKWLMGRRVLGPILQDYLRHRAVSRRTRRVTLVLLWSGLGASALVLRARGLWVPVSLGLTGAAVTLHLLLLRTRPAEADQSGDPGASDPSSAAIAHNSARYSPR